MDLSEIVLEKEVEDFCNYCKKNSTDYNKEDIISIRKAFQKKIKDNNYHVEQCIIKTEKFELDLKEFGIRFINVLFFYPNEYFNKENEKKEYNCVFYIHSGGFCLYGGEMAHKLPREICNFTNSIVVYPEYSLSPEVKVPIHLEECYATLCHLEKISKEYRMNFKQLIIGGDSAGGNLSLGLSILCKERLNSPNIKKMILINPRTDCNYDRQSYKKYSNGFVFLKQHSIFFAKQYLDNEKQLQSYLLCPIKASKEQLENLPETLFIHAKYDILFDEGIEMCEKLKEAGVKVKSEVFQSIHSFCNFYNLQNTKTSKDATNLILEFINKGK